MHRRAFAHLRLVAHAQRAARHFGARAGACRRCRSGLPRSAAAASILVGGATHSLTGMSRLPSSSFDAARKWPMLVMHEPMNTSSILVPATSDSVFTSSGIVRAGHDRLVDVGQVDLDDGGVLGVRIGLQQLRVGEPRLHRLDAALQRARVGVAVGDHPLHQRDVAVEVLDDRLLVQVHRAAGGRALGRGVATVRTPARPSGRAGLRFRGCGRRRCSSCLAWRPSAGPA